MKAILLRSPGGPEQFVPEEWPQPVPAAGQVLVQIKAAALNRRDLLLRTRATSQSMMPFIPGSDGAGVIAALGPSVSGPRPGDEVVINPALEWGAQDDAPSPQFRILGGPDDGTFAEYVCVPAENVFPKPPHLSFQEAAAFPLAGLTVWRALVSKARVQTGEWVLIHGVGSGTGTLAVQVARFCGARVIVTSHDDVKLKKALSLGAEVAINYAHRDWKEEVRRVLEGRGVDVVLDSIGRVTFAGGLDELRHGGRLVTFGSTSGSMTELDVRMLYHKQLSLYGTTMGSPHEFSGMLAAVESGFIRPVVDRVFPLSDAAAASRYMEQQDQFGKIVLTVA